MQLASLISDLTTLRACDHTAAWALVNAASGNSEVGARAATSGAATDEVEQDADMKRAKSLLRLHQEVKVAFTPSPDVPGSRIPADLASTNRELQEARSKVATALHSLGINPGSQMSSAQLKFSSQAAESVNQAVEVGDEDDDAALEAWS